MLDTVALQLNEFGRGVFYVQGEDKHIAQMDIATSGSNITVFRTEVNADYENQGVAGKLFEAMVQYARDKNMKVIALCRYVNERFNRHPEQYADIWNQKWRNG